MVLVLSSEDCLQSSWLSCYLEWLRYEMGLSRDLTQVCYIFIYLMTDVVRLHIFAHTEVSYKFLLSNSFDSEFCKWTKQGWQDVWCDSCCVMSAVEYFDWLKKQPVNQVLFNWTNKFILKLSCHAIAVVFSNLLKLQFCTVQEAFCNNGSRDIVTP